MLRVGCALSRNCTGVSRRELLQVGGSTAFGLSLAAALSADAQPPAKADSCIVFWLNGGPSQDETVDPKPEQPSEVRGSYAPIETNVSGIRISSLLPRLARQADKYTIVRSFTHESSDRGGPESEGGAGAIHLYDRQAEKLLPLPALNSAGQDSQPSISPGGRFIAFTSDRLGGAGQQDVYLYDRREAKLLPTPGLNSPWEDYEPAVIALDPDTDRV